MLFLFCHFGFSEPMRAFSKMGFITNWEVCKSRACSSKGLFVSLVLLRFGISFVQSLLEIS